MAYDPKDPADKKIVDDAVAAALAEAADEHETAITGLKAKNTELLGKLKDAREGKGADPAEAARLEAELDKVLGELKTERKALATVTKERDTFKAQAESESGFSTKLLVENGLTAALVGAGVKKEFMPAVTAMLSGKVTIKQDGDTRAAVVGDKSLGDFVKEWSQGADGKHYIAAEANSGGGANGGKAGGSGKTMKRADYDAADANTRAAHFAEGGTLTD